MKYGGDHGEFAYARVSVHVCICSGLNVTVAALPRYTIHENRKPGPLDGMIDEGGLGPDATGGGCPARVGLGCPLPARLAGRLSGSFANATNVSGSPTFTIRRLSPSTVSSGGTLVRSSSRRLPPSPPTSVEITCLSIS